MDFAIAKYYQGRLIYAEECSFLEKESTEVRRTFGFRCPICEKEVVFRRRHEACRFYEESWASATDISPCFTYSCRKEKSRCKLDLQVFDLNLKGNIQRRYRNFSQKSFYRTNKEIY